MRSARLPTRLARCIALGLTCLLASCGDPDLNATASPLPAAPSGSWELVAGSVDGSVIEDSAGNAVTLVIDGPSIAGLAPCNRYFGSWTVSAEGVEVDQIATTRMGCAMPIMAAEELYIRALESVDHFSVELNELLLSGPGVELRFTRVE